MDTTTLIIIIVVLVLLFGGAAVTIGVDDGRCHFSHYFEAKNSR